MGIPLRDLPPHVQHQINEAKAQDSIGRVKKRRNKYGAERVELDGIRFDSKREAAFYSELTMRQGAGDIRYFHRQPIFDLPGGVRYVCDFLLVHNDGAIEYVDTKSPATAKDKTYRVKKKQTEAIYGITIKEV